MNKPICVQCETEFRMEVAGIYVTEMFQKNKEVYKLWSADLWKCPICDTRIVFGFGNKPCVHHADEDEMKAKLKEIQDGGHMVIRNLELTGRGIDG